MSDKRKTVEFWLDELCSSLESFESMEDDYHPGEYDSDKAEIVAETDGLIRHVSYEPGSDAWENFESEGWLWSTPSDAQVEALYPKALKDLATWKE